MHKRVKYMARCQSTPPQRTSHLTLAYANQIMPRELSAALSHESVAEVSLIAPQVLQPMLLGHRRTLNTRWRHSLDHLEPSVWLLQGAAMSLQQPPCTGEATPLAACIIGSCQLALLWSWEEPLTPCFLQHPPKVHQQRSCYSRHCATGMVLLLKFMHRGGWRHGVAIPHVCCSHPSCMLQPSLMYVPVMHPENASGPWCQNPDRWV